MTGVTVGPRASRSGSGHSVEFGDRSTLPVVGSSVKGTPAGSTGTPAPAFERHDLPPVLRRPAVARHEAARCSDSIRRSRPSRRAVAAGARRSLRIHSNSAVSRSSRPQHARRFAVAAFGQRRRGQRPKPFGRAGNLAGAFEPLCRAACSRASRNNERSRCPARTPSAVGSAAMPFAAAGSPDRAALRRPGPVRREKSRRIGRRP